MQLVWQAHWWHFILQQTGSVDRSDFLKKSIRGVAPRFWMRATTTASFFLENMHGKHVGSGSPTMWFHIHMDVASGITNTSQVSVTFFIHIGCWYDIFSGKHPTPQSKTLSAVLFFMLGNSRKKRRINWWAVRECRWSVVGKWSARINFRDCNLHCGALGADVAAWATEEASSTALCSSCSRKCTGGN